MRVGILADAHVGSAFGPWPPEAELSIGGRHQPNIGQQYLVENWYRIAEELPALDVLILNGDIIDGQQPKDRGRYLVEEDPLYQARAAHLLLQPFLAKSRVRYCTEGTGYHEGDGAMAAEWLAREIGAVNKDEHHCWDWLLLEMGGLNWDIAHRQSIMMRYRSTAMEREMQFSAMLSDSADVLVRSHNHSYAYLQMVSDGGLQHSVSTPAWQLQTHFARTSISPNRLFSSQLGMVVLETEGKAVFPRPFLFAHPPMRRAIHVTA